MQIVHITKRAVSKLAAYFRELWWYIRHLVKGTTYAEYYADRMNRIVKKNPDWGLNLNKRFQLEYLQRHGLKPDAAILDYGCGALAAGLHFIEFLDEGRYTGLDISPEVLREGQRRLERGNLTKKHPLLLLLGGRLADTLAARRFDFIWAQSVLTHMPPADIRNLLRDIRPYMNEGAVFFATFARTDGSPGQKRFKDWYYNEEFFRNEAALSDLNVEFMGDWKHPDDPDGHDAMARFTLKGGQ